MGDLIERTPKASAAVSCGTAKTLADSSCTRPSGADRIGYLVVVPSMVSGFDCPVYAQITGMGTMRNKATKSSVVWNAVEYTQGMLTGVTFVIEEDLLEFAVADAVAMNADPWLFQTVWFLNNGSLYCGQVTDFELKKSALLVTVACRDNSPFDEKSVVNVSTVTPIVKTAFILGFGHGAPVGKKSLYIRWHTKLKANVGCVPSVGMLTAGTKATIPPFVNGTLEMLDGEGESLWVDIEQFIQTDVLLSEGVKGKAVASVAAPDPVNAKLAPMQRNLGNEFDSESSDDEEPFIPPPVNSQYGLKAEKLGKAGIPATQGDLDAHVLLFSSDLETGEFVGLGINDRAQFVLCTEQSRADYVVTHSRIMLIMFGHVLGAPLSYFLPVVDVPTNPVQSGFDGKWKDKIQPPVWIKSMDQLTQSIRVIYDISRRYYKPNVAAAVNLVYAASLEETGVDRDLAISGVLAFRDLYQQVLGRIRHAVVWNPNVDLCNLVEADLRPSSNLYYDIISKRLDRIQRRANVWGGFTQQPSNLGGLGKNPTNRPKLTEDLRRLIPTGPDGNSICLGFQSVKGCKAPKCRYEHDLMELPRKLQTFVKKCHGDLK